MSDAGEEAPPMLADAGSSPDVDAAVADDAASCGAPSVTHVQADDVGGLPMGSCGAGAVACQSTPRVTFACPSVGGAADSSTIAPGDTITIVVPMTNSVALAYPCFGLTADHGIVGTTPGITVYEIAPTDGYPVQFTVQLPSSLAPGTVIHFVAYVVLSPCPGDTGAVGFDVTVG
jgi:hypothetical protein